MNIAMMTNSFAPLVGGVSISVERLTRGLRDFGHSVTVFAPEHPQMQEAGLTERVEADLVRCRTFCTVGSFPLPSIFDPQPFREFKKRRFDLIHVHHPMFMGNLAWVLAKLHNLPLVFTWHTLYGQYMHYLGCMRRLEKQSKEGRLGAALASKIHTFICDQVVPWYISAFARRCDLVMVPSPGIKEVLNEWTEGLTVEVMPTGIPKNFFYCPAEEVELIRERWSRNGKWLFCTVSRLGQEKNITFLLLALAAYKERWGDVFSLLIIGDGPQREELEGVVNNMGLAGQVSFLGTIANERLNAFYHAADVFLFSSKTETQGIVLLEAMAGGLPVVALEASGVRDVVRNGQNGRLVNESVEDFISALNVLCHDKQTYRNYAQEALNTARRYHSSSIAAIAENTYLETIAAHRKEKAHAFKTVAVVSKNSGSDLPH